MEKKISLKNKKILVTAGSTWIPIDTVRVITNIFKGNIGFVIAKTAAELGAEVTLLLGPSFSVSNLKLPKKLTILRFKYFDDLDKLMTENLKNNKFDAVIHSAAVSDFKLSKEYKGKIKSDKKLILELVPTIKIVDKLKKIDPSIFLVKFKLEVGITPEKLKSIAAKSMVQSDADMIVANIYNPKFSDHEAYIGEKKSASEKKESFTKVVGRQFIANKVLQVIHDKN